MTIAPITLLDNHSEANMDNTTCGSNKFFYENYTIHFVLTGDPNCQVRVSLTNSIQLTARFNMDINDFYNLNGPTEFIDRMCALLGVVDTSRLKIVGIYNGSVTIVAFIDEESTTDAETASQNDNQAKALEMEEMQRNLTALYDNGDIDSEFTSAGFGPLTSLESSMYDHFDDSVDDEDEIVIPLQSMIGLIIGATFGGVMILGFVGYFIYKKCMKAPATKIQPMETTITEEHKIS